MIAKDRLSAVQPPYPSKTHRIALAPQRTVDFKALFHRRDQRLFLRTISCYKPLRTLNPTPIGTQTAMQP
jgi:hypothetical protein